MSGGFDDDVVADPVGVITAAVAAVDASVSPGAVREVVARSCVQRAARRRLAQSLKDHPDVLRTGRPPGPLSAARLLLALRQAGADEVAAPRCGGCERELNSLRSMRGGDWGCSPCLEKWEDCAGCGERRRVNSRDRRGHARCADCPDDEDDPAAELASDIDYNSREGYGANKVAAENVLLDSGMPVSVLRPSRIHGTGASRPREWVFVKRAFDGRRRLLLAHGGRGANHPTAAVNLAALAAFCAARPGVRILNSADPDAPDGLAISRIIAAHLAHAWTEILLDKTAPDDLGDHPWNTLPPYLLDTSAAQRLGFVPAGSYAETVKAEMDWLVQAARSGDPAGVLPSPEDPYFRSFFDYAREDAWLNERSSSTHPWTSDRNGWAIPTVLISDCAVSTARRRPGPAV